MKKVLPLCLLLSFSQIQTADAGILYHDAGTGVAILCAPEVVESNLNTTDKILTTLAQSEEFKNQDMFKKVVREISQSNDDREKMVKYFDLIELKNDDDIINFIGARKSQYEGYSATLSKNTELPTELSNKVIEALTTSLKGGLK